METLKIKINAARVNAELTQEEAAKRLHVSPATINNWESGRTNPPYIAMQAMSILYNIPVEFLTTRNINKETA